MAVKIGKQTIEFESGVGVLCGGSAVGKTEGDGPLGECFDLIITDDYFGEKTYEQAEIKLQKYALRSALDKAGLQAKDLDFVTAGDLLNQCVSSSYSVRNNGVPFMGLFGACSTMALSLIAASCAMELGYARLSAGVTSSHFCSAERQFRQPLEYGGQRAPGAQRTVTAGAAAILSKEAAVKIKRATLGCVVDYSVTDMSNMGAAMAPAAADTLARFFEDTCSLPSDYDGIFSGDLGAVGASILRDLMKERGFPLGENYNDCGLMIYDREKQDVHSGGSGCGCSGAVLTAFILPSVERGTYSNVLFMSTGALMSPTISQQGESIPGVAHLVELSIR